jgi:hypothetical protein
MKSFQKKMNSLLFIMMFFYFPAFSQQAGDCKVLKKELVGEYSGKCKDGLANGKGHAKGIDEYEGSFKKGLPHGNGVYHYADSSVYTGAFSSGMRSGNGVYTFRINEKDSTLDGIWKEDKYIKAKPVRPYEVKLQRNISRYSFTKINEMGNNISLNISRAGVPLKPNDISLLGSSGNAFNNSSNIGFDQVSFPFTGIVKYSMSNQMSQSSFLVEFEFTIKEPGSWDIRLSH